MSSQPKCSKCGSPLAADVPGQLCLRCLLGFGLKGSVGDEPGDQTMAMKPGDTSTVIAEDTFDRYRVIEQLGEGGCGIVYRAEQLAPVRREVALKVIKLGMDTKTVIARFEAERQALAMMDHPNIAKVFDAGTTGGGRPFFVMELVCGERITDFCDNKKLSISQRLELFARVCQAIQHAHQKGIIHRDIKPSNVLVVEQDGVPTPKVIDFGIAKATARQRLSDQTIYTAFDQFVGTPAYMSPEQAGLTDEDIDTRSDVYSLGVLLYELLTGRPPFEPERLRRAALDEICRIIREEEPSRPSMRLTTFTQDELSKVALSRLVSPPKLSNELRGDLDWLAMKALEKDRDRRYDTANGLAADIRRHLDNEPILARPPSLGYQVRKFTRRHRAAVLAVAAVALALVAAAVISTTQAVRARRAEAQARREAATSAQVKKFLERMIIFARPGVAPEADVGVLKNIMERLAQEAKKEFANQPDVLADLLFNLGLTYAQLDENVRAIEVLQDATAAAEKMVPPDYGFQALILDYTALSTRRVRGDDDAEVVAQAALAMRRRQPGVTEEQLDRSIGFQLLTDIPMIRGELDAALVAVRRFVRAREGAGNPHETAEAVWMLGKMLTVRGDWAEAEGVFRCSFSNQVAITGSRDNIAAIPRNYCSLGDVMRELGRWEEAEKMYRAANEYNHSMKQPDYASALVKLGSLYDFRGRTNEADAQFQAALALERDELVQWPSARVSILVKYGKFRSRLGDFQAAGELLDRAIALTRRNKLDPSPGLLTALVGLARKLHDTRDPAGALSRFQAAQDLAATVKNSQRDYTLGTFFATAAAFQNHCGHTNEAQSYRVELRDLLEHRLYVREQTHAEPSCHLVDMQSRYAALCQKFGDVAEAETNHVQAINFCRQLTYANGEIITAYENYLAFLTAQNRPEAAAVRTELEKLKTREKQMPKENL